MKITQVNRAFLSLLFLFSTFVGEYVFADIYDRINSCQATVQTDPSCLFNLLRELASASTNAPKVYPISDCTLTVEEKPSCGGTCDSFVIENKNGKELYKSNGGFDLERREINPTTFAEVTKQLESFVSSGECRVKEITTVPSCTVGTYEAPSCGGTCDGFIISYRGFGEIFRSQSGIDLGRGDSYETVDHSNPAYIEVTQTLEDYKSRGICD